MTGKTNGRTPATSLPCEEMNEKKKKKNKKKEKEK